MIDMLKRHEIQVLRRAGHSQIEVATLAGVARRTVQRVDGEAGVTQIDSGAVRTDILHSHARVVVTPADAPSFSRS